MHHPATWTPPADEIVTLQALVQRLDDLLGLQNMENNRLKAAELAARPSIEAILAAIDKQIEAVRKQIMGHIADHPDLKTLRAAQVGPWYPQMPPFG